MYFKFPNLCLHHIVDLDMFRESQYIVELDYLGSFRVLVIIDMGVFCVMVNYWK